MPTLKCKGLQHLKNNPVISLSVHKKKKGWGVRQEKTEKQSEIITWVTQNPRDPPSLFYNVSKIISMNSSCPPNLYLFNFKFSCNSHLKDTMFLRFSRCHKCE